MACWLSSLGRVSELDTGQRRGVGKLKLSPSVMDPNAFRKKELSGGNGP